MPIPFFAKPLTRANGGYSYRPEVQMLGSPTWVSLTFRFSTERECRDFLKDIATRKTLILDTRVARTEDKVNAVWICGRVV